MTPSLALWNAVSAALAFLGSGPLKMIRAAMQVPVLAACCMARSANMGLQQLLMISKICSWRSGAAADSSNSCHTPV